MNRKDTLLFQSQNRPSWIGLLVTGMACSILAADEPTGTRTLNSLRRNAAPEASVSRDADAEATDSGRASEPTPLRSQPGTLTDGSTRTTPRSTPPSDASSRNSLRRPVVRQDVTDEEPNASPPTERSVGPEATPPGELSDGIAAESADSLHQDLRASQFKDVTPGETTSATLLELWGKPIKEAEEDGTLTWTFAVEPLEKVEILIQNDKVSAILLYLAEPETRADLEAELGLANLTPVVVRGESGEPLGLSFPERGVVCGFAPNSESQRFAQVVLEPLSIEPFWLRAQESTGRHYQLYLADVEFVLQHQPEFADAHWVKSKILAQAGRYQESLQAIEQALVLQENDPRYRLARSVPRFELDEQEAALEDLVAVLQDEQATELVRARARLQLGHFLQTNSSRLFRDALGHYSKALELASPLAASELSETRQEALHILIEAYFASAIVISRGQWANKQEAIDKWLKTGAELAGAVLEGGEAQPELRLLAIQQTLSAYRGLPTPNDATSAVERLVREADRLIGLYPDPIFQQQVATIFIDGILAAMEIAQLRDTDKVARQYAEQGTVFLQKLDANVISAPRTQRLVASFYFQVGLLQALHGENHPLAIEAYERSREYCDKLLPEASPALLGKFGEWYVSMGISYWQEESHELAMELTQQGLDWMQTAERAGKIDKQALLIPMRNLATMYRARNEKEAYEQMTARAAALEESLNRSTRR